MFPGAGNDHRSIGSLPAKNRFPCRPPSAHLTAPIAKKFAAEGFTVFAGRGASIQRPQRTQDFLPQLSITGLLKRLPIEAACRRSQRWCDVFARAARGRHLRQQPRKAPEIADGSTLPDRGVGIMTMSEYEEQFRSPTPSLHQTFAEARGPNRGRRRSRPFWVAAALVGVMSMTMNVMSHHTVHSAASNRSQLCESGIR